MKFGVDLCRHCNLAVYDNAIKCVLCDFWLHFECCDFGDDNAKDFFLCISCESHFKKGESFKATNSAKTPVADEELSEVASLEPVEHTHHIADQVLTDNDCGAGLSEPSISDPDYVPTFEDEDDGEVKVNAEPRNDNFLSPNKVVINKGGFNLTIKFGKASDTKVDVTSKVIKPPSEKFKKEKRRGVKRKNGTQESDTKVDVNSEVIPPPSENGEFGEIDERLELQSQNKKGKVLKRKNGTKSKKKSINEQANLGKQFFSDHIKTVIDEKLNCIVYSCTSCAKFRPTIHALKAEKHAFLHEKLTKSGNKVKRKPKAKENCFCSACDFKCVYKKDLRNHYKNFHPSMCGEVCASCGKSFLNYTYLKRHIRLVHLGIKNYSCDVCDYKCRDVYDLNKHKKKHFSAQANSIINDTDNTTEVNSPNCDNPSDIIAGINSNDMSIDQLNNEIEKDPIKNCTYCDKTFVDNIKLNRHIKSHLEISTFSCDICNKKFRDNHNLKRHSRIHNKVFTEFVCNFCNKTYPSNTKLLKHMNKIHKQEFDENEIDDVTMGYIENEFNVNHDPFSTNNNYYQEDGNIKNLGSNGSVNYSDFEGLVNESHPTVAEIVTLNIEKGFDGISEPFHIGNGFFQNVKMSNVKEEDSSTHFNNDFGKTQINSEEDSLSKNDSESNIFMYVVNCNEEGNQVPVINNTDIDQSEYKRFMLKQDEEKIDDWLYNYCKLCKGVYLESSLSKHMKNLHSDEAVNCLKCDKIFQDKSSFLNHRPCKRWNCQKCKKAFSKHSDYIKHTNTHV